VKQHGFAPILIVTILAAVLGGYFYFQKSQTSPTTPTSPIHACSPDSKMCSDGSHVSRIPPNCDFAPCPTSSTTSSADMTNWKTYTNTKKGYSFKYPSDWQLLSIRNVSGGEITADDNDQTTARLVSPAKPCPSGITNDPTVCGFGEVIEIMIQDNPKDLSLKEFVDTHNVYVDKNKIRSEPFLLNGIDGLKVDIVGFSAPFYYFKKGAKLFEIADNKSFWLLKEKASLFNQILSTFKFTK